MQRRDVAHGVEPQSTVVEVLEPLPVAGRAANVRLDDGEALGGEVLDERDPHRPPLRLRAAVDLEEDRRRRLRRGAVDDERDRLAVERREALDGRCHEPVRRDPGRALRQPVRATRRRVEEPRVPRRHRRREPVREAGAGGRHDEAVEHPPIREVDRASPLEGVGVVQLEAGAPVHVGVDRDDAAVPVAEAVEVPVVLDHVAPLACGRHVARDRRRVSAAARREEERRRVARPDGSAEQRVVLVGRDEHDGALDEVDEMEVVVPGVAGQLEDAEPATVGREAGDLAVPAEVEHALLPAGLEIAEVDVEIAPVAPVARVREAAAAGVEPRRLVQELRLDHERLRYGARPRVEEVELRTLVSPLVEREQDAIASGNEPPGDGLTEVGELHGLSPGRDEVELEAAGDVPADERGAVVPHVGGQRPADLEQLPERRHAMRAATRRSGRRWAHRRRRRSRRSPSRRIHRSTVCSTGTTSRSPAPSKSPARTGTPSFATQTSYVLPSGAGSIELSTSTAEPSSPTTSRPSPVSRSTARASGSESTAVAAC